MLVVSRKPGEAVWIGDIRVVVLDVPHRNKIRIGIEAPQDLVVLREELRKLPRKGEVKK